MPFAVRDLEHPIVQAPMGGGVSTPALAAAVSGAGGLGFLAAGYKPVDGVRADIEAVRAATGRPFGVNLFAPPRPVPDPGAVERYARELAERHDDAALRATTTTAGRTSWRSWRPPACRSSRSRSACRLPPRSVGCTTRASPSGPP